MRDPYDVLGVQKTASAAEIKAGFRKLAKKLHPDANKTDPKAATRFAEINAAYEIVGDEDKRKAFDRGEIDAEGKPRFQGFEGFGAGGGRAGQGREGFSNFNWSQDGARQSAGPSGFGGFEDILKDVFGGTPRGGARRPRQPFQFDTEDPAASSGGDVNVAITVSLADVAHGATKRVRLPTGKEMDVKIPAGLGDGKQIRLKGQGLTGPGFAGDALITVHIAKHPYFEVDGRDLRLDLPVTLYEAVLGGKVRVPTLDGAVELALPAGTNGGRTFRLKGKGLPDGAGHTGDLLATVRLVLPERSDAELQALMRKWADGHTYDPRKDLG